MVTQTGTNKLRGSFMFNGTDDDLQFNNISPELRAGAAARRAAAGAGGQPRSSARDRRC